jgi:c-di-GMP-binding flagellar brake protein YcgR
VQEFEMMGSVHKKEYEAGIKFSDISEEDKETVCEYVFSLIPKKPQL